MTTGAPTESGFASRTGRGLLWTTAQKWVSRVSGLLTVLILARVLTPADFGLVAVVLSVVPAVYLLADLGFSSYLVQASDPTPRTFSTAFWYSAGSGVLLAIGLWLIGPGMEVLLHAPGAAAVMAGLAPAVVMVALGAVPLALLRREMRFRSLAIQSFSAAITGQIVAVVLALTGFGVWALVAQTIVMQAVATLLAWVSARWLPRWAFSPREFFAMVRYGTSVVLVELVALSRLWAENAIVAATLGLTGLGYLNIAQRLVQVAQDLTAAAITPVTTVVFAQIRSHASRLAAGYVRAQGVVYAVIIPVMIFIAVGASHVVPLLFGPQWGTSVLPSQALAVAGVLTVGAALDQALFYGLGRPGRWLMYAVAVDLLTVVATLVAAPFGLVAVGWAFVAVALVATCIRVPLVAGRLGIGARALAAQFLRALLLGALVAGGGGIVASLTAGWPAMAALPVIGLAIVATWMLTLRAVMPLTAAEVRSQATAVMRAARTRVSAQRTHAVGGR